MCRSIAEAVLAHGRKHPGKLAVADPERTYSYGELAKAAVIAAGVLHDRSVERGDYVLVECTQKAEFLILDLACELLGAVFVPLEKKMTESRVRSIYQDTGAKCVISETDYAAVGVSYGIAQIMEDVGERYGQGTDTVKEPFDRGMEIAGRQSGKRSDTGPEMLENGESAGLSKDSLAEILFTTGTTGQPKGIMISHRANLAIAENISCGTKMSEDTVELIPMPLSHSHGLRTCYANLLNGSAVVIVDGVMNIALLFRLIDELQVNALDISPTLAKLLLKIARKGLAKCSERMDYIEIGTAFLDDELKAQLKALFPSTRLYNFYGSTEAGRSCVLDFNEMDFSGCIGYPSKNASFLIVDDERRPIESSKENPGLVAVSGSMMMDGYFGSEELTRATLVDGVLYTSDLGYIDEAGRVYVLGRRDDIINYKGIKIAPEEIETVAMQYADITDCACVPVEDGVRGQVPKLFVSVRSGADYREKSLFDFLRAHLEATRVPVYIEAIDEIPRSSNGKLQRKRLRENEATK